VSLISEILNHNSYGLAAGIVILWLGWEGLRARTRRSLLIFALVAVALVAPPLWLRSAQSSLGELDVALAAGQPAMLELYSDL
jgi:hypothetical protein